MNNTFSNKKKLLEKLCRHRVHAWQRCVSVATHRPLLWRYSRHFICTVRRAILDCSFRDTHPKPNISDPTDYQSWYLFKIPSLFSPRCAMSVQQSRLAKLSCRSARTRFRKLWVCWLHCHRYCLRYRSL